MLEPERLSSGALKPRPISSTAPPRSDQRNAVVVIFANVVSQLMIAYEDLTQVDLDPELELQKGSAMFACLCGKCE
jgi:hypothetical protein